MFEHVGRHRLSAYFHKICQLLEDDGLFSELGDHSPAARSATTLKHTSLPMLVREPFPHFDFGRLSLILAGTRCYRELSLRVQRVGTTGANRDAAIVQLCFSSAFNTFGHR
jgi:cyclopropane fatty-acyl-phospholipid synthase-like methyltransferase